jgi:WhiB family redox-sensing transcriptional regulator
VADIRRLPKPRVDEWSWQLQAACRGLPVSLFFHPWGERTTERTRRIQKAKQVCQECPVVFQCRSWALQVQERYGIWGGLSEEERAYLLGHERR